MGSINSVTLKAVAFRPIHQVVTGELPIIRRGIGVMIICRDNHERHLFDRRDVHSFVKGARLNSALPNGGKAHESFFAFESFRHERANRDRHHSAEVTDHGELAFGRPTTVNVAVAPAHRPLSRAKISPGNIDKWLAKSGSSRLISNKRREDIALL